MTDNLMMQQQQHLNTSPTAAAAAGVIPTTSITTDHYTTTTTNTTTNASTFTTNNNIHAPTTNVIPSSTTTTNTFHHNPAQHKNFDNTTTSFNENTHHDLSYQDSDVSLTAQLRTCTATNNNVTLNPNIHAFGTTLGTHADDSLLHPAQTGQTLPAIATQEDDVTAIFNPPDAHARLVGNDHQSSGNVDDHQKIMPCVNLADSYSYTAPGSMEHDVKLKEDPLGAALMFSIQPSVVGNHAASNSNHELQSQSQPQLHDLNHICVPKQEDSLDPTSILSSNISADVVSTAAAAAAAYGSLLPDAEDIVQTQEIAQMKMIHTRHSCEDSMTSGGSIVCDHGTSLSGSDGGGGESREQHLASRRLKDRERYASMSHEQREEYNHKRREQYHRQSEECRKKRRERERIRYHSLPADKAKERNMRRAALERERYKRLSPEELAARNARRRARAASMRAQKKTVQQQAPLKGGQGTVTVPQVLSTPATAGVSGGTVGTQDLTQIQSLGAGHGMDGGHEHGALDPMLGIVLPLVTMDTAADLACLPHGLLSGESGSDGDGGHCSTGKQQGHGHDPVEPNV